MKVSDLNNMIQNIVSEEVKKKIIKESEDDKNMVYHVTCEGEPVSSHKSMEEAHSHKQVLEKEHPEKKFDVVNKKYKSYGHMLDELDNHSEKLEDSEKLKSMKDMVNSEEMGEDYDCESCNGGDPIWEEDEMNENGDPQEFHAKVCNECGGSINEEGMCNECGKMYEDAAGGDNQITDGMGMEEGQHVCDECGGMLDESQQCMECGKMMDEHAKDNDAYYTPTEEQPVSENKMCNECGGMINEEGMCNECGMMYEDAKDGDPQYHHLSKEFQPVHESRKKTIRLTETEMIKLIKRIVKESTPGIPGVNITKRNQERSGKENEDHIKATEKKMKDYLSFDGNDNPEFPHQVGETKKKMARENSKEQDEEVAKNKANPLNLTYDIEPSEDFKKRLKMSIEGDSKMGNAPTTEKPSIKPSNGADKGKEAKEKSGSSIPTPETGKKIEKQMKDREEDKKKRVLYPKEAVPINESKVNFSNILLEEMDKMKNLSSYNKKTQ